VIAVFSGAAAEAAAFAGTSAGAFTATEGVIDGSTAAGTSDNGIVGMDRGAAAMGAWIFTTRGEGRRAAPRNGIERTCAAAGAAIQATTITASACLTSPL